jgi:hypothetical protein
MRWGFEEYDEDDDYAEGHDHLASPGPGGGDASDEVIRRSGPDGLVEIAVNDEGVPVSVALAQDWKASVRPHELHASVTEAYQAATVTAALAEHDEAGFNDRSGGVLPSDDELAAFTMDDSPLTARDINRLVSGVAADAQSLADRMTEYARQRAEVESGGGHVRIAGESGQVGQLVLDPRWASGARNSEIEAELLDALRKFHSRSGSGDDLNVLNGSLNFRELFYLVKNPEVMMRRIMRGHGVDA